MSGVRDLLLVAAATSLVVSCGADPPIPDEDVRFRIVVGVRDAEVGKSFPLTVIRAWRRDLVPEDWDDGALAPLVVRPIATVRREDARHVEETRTFRAYAFDSGDVVAPAAKFTAHAASGGAPRSASGDSIVLRVRSSLDARNPGPPELPGDLLPEPIRWTRWAIGAAVAAALALLVRRRRAARVDSPAVAATPTAVPPAPHDVALARLDRLRASAPRDVAETERWFIDVSGVVREYVATRFAAPSDVRTSEELMASEFIEGGPAARHRAALAATLSACDAVKFARDVPDAAGRARAIDAATSFVRATASADGDAA